MRRKRQTPELLPPKVPGYIVTFSDMVTLLLTFFVMLLTLANEQDPALFNKGRDSFIRSMAYVGLGMFFGRQNTATLGNAKTRHPISQMEETNSGRTIDAKREMTRRVLQQITSQAKVIPSDFVASKARFWLTSVRFAPGEAELDEEDKRALRRMYRTLSDVGNLENTRLYVLGLAAEAATPAKQFQLSARRAEVVAQFLNTTFGADLAQPVCSWGAGDGGDWVGSGSMISDKSQIVIGLLKQQPSGPLAR